MKTLIVEDDFTSRLLLQSLLSSHGECHTVANGYEAIKAFGLATDHGTPYDLVCMDIMMPGMTGQETVRSLRSMEEDRQIASHLSAKIIMTTGLSRPKDVSESFKSLCDAYLTKPLDGRQLVECLRSCHLLQATSPSPAPSLPQTTLAYPASKAPAPPEMG